MLLRGFAREGDAALLQAIEAVIHQAPLRHMQTPGGYTMSVATTSCGPLGWVSDQHGYRYAARDPHSGQPWPAMPACLLELADGDGQKGRPDRVKTGQTEINRRANAKPQRPTSQPAQCHRSCKLLNNNNLRYKHQDRCNMPKC
ncbi:alpha-ketoglutarate-dependent dioxygenase AlkB [Rhodoferax sp.]|uniref:alpha-ketoglutarate-dependent dioxygenase AlkB n=1 Tax=Rhodoferax sp. TaxID=50421 RepID=UPI0039B9095C